MTPAELRRLPFVLHPLPDEPFGSWFETMAATLGTTCGDLARALGLRIASQGPLGSTSWSVQLDDHQLDNLERTTGLYRDVLRATTREGFAANGLQYDRRGAISIFSPISGASGRYCPDCLRDSNGRWRLTWQFPFGFACVRHRRLLVDVCPKCRRAPHRTALPHRLVPTPGACRTPTGHHENGRVKRCGADLRDVHAEQADVDSDVLAAQRLVLRALSKPRIADGIWSSAPQPTTRVLGDLRLLAGYARRSVQEPEGRHSQGPRNAVTAADLAAAYAAACRALHEPMLLEELLRSKVTANTPYDGLSPQLQALIAGARGTKRRATFVLQTAFDSDNPAGRAAKIPALLWPDWTDRLAPRRNDRTSAAAALSAAVVVTGNRLTYAAGLRLLDHEAPSRPVTSLMRLLGTSGTEPDTLSTIMRLARYLDGFDTPIDYSRRRSLDYSDLLALDEWEQIAIAQNIHTGLPRRGVLARAYVHRLLSGDRARCLRTLDVAAEPVTDAELDGFGRRAPARVLAALTDAGTEHLRRIGIDEPPTWQPALSALGLHAFVVNPASGEREEWSPRRPARGHPGGPEAMAIRAAHDDGLSIRAAADKLGLSRQTVSRTLEATGVTSRPGRRPRFHIDAVWLREQYETERRSAADIANDVGCSQTTILKHVHVHGLTPTLGRATEGEH